MADDTRARERRLRRAADHQGLKLHKAPSRQRKGLAGGGYMLTDRSASGLVVLGDAPAPYSATLDEVERYLVNE
jgi:hypothetical protein